MDGPSIRDLQFNDQNTLHLYCAIPFALSIREVSKHLFCVFCHVVGLMEMRGITRTPMSHQGALPLSARHHFTASHFVQPTDS